MKRERGNVHDGANNTVQEDKGQVEEGSSASMLHHSQETVQALTDALIELQMELRDRCQECEVLRVTVEALSSELRTSDSNLEEAELRAEKLDFRLQAVSYCYQSDQAANEEAEMKALSDNESMEVQQRLATDKERKKNKKKSKSVKKDKSDRKSKDEKKKDKKRKKHKSSKSKAEREPPSEVECRDDINSEPRHEPEAEPEPEASSISPCRAAFQNALRERDQARSDAHELADLLEESQLHCEHLTNRLDRMTALVELAYQDESCSKEVMDSNTNVKRSFKWGTKRGSSGVDPDVATYRKDEEKSHSRCIVSCPSSPDRAAGPAPRLVEI
jgi:chromosome segregation ATPase